MGITKMEVKTLTAPPIKEVIFDIRVNQLGIGSDQILKYFDDQYLSIQEQLMMCRRKVANLFH